MNKLIIPYDMHHGNTNSVYSENAIVGQPETNRSLEISLKGDTDKNFSVGIKDINEAVEYYFKNVLRLSVVQNNIHINVPIIYGTPENWASVQADGYYRDGTSKLMAPLLMFKRNTITQNRGLGYKLDGNVAHNVQVFEKRYNPRDSYNNFNVLNSRSPSKEYIVVVTPDYVTIQYTCMIWTHFVEQMDKLIESLNYASRSYWGDPKKFQFYSDISSFEDSTSFNTGDDRLIRSSFTLTLNGWLIPDSINKYLSTVNRQMGISQVVFGFETAMDSETFVANKMKPKSKKLSNTIVSDSQNVIVNQTISNVSPESLLYVNLNKQVAATSITENTAIFSNSWVYAPAGFPATSVDNFTFFCNGQLVEKTAIVSFTQSGGNSTLTIDPNLLGYSFESSDEIIGIGKFS